MIPYLPQDIHGWTVAATGLLLVAYRAYGTWRPRPWAEWVERQFTYATNLRLFGLVLLLAVGGILYSARYPEHGAVAWLFLFSIILFAGLGLGLLLLQNHVRHLVLASAEGSDRGIQAWSVLVVLAGLWMVAVAVL